ncbi:MAG: hypothetical protein Q7R93_04705, partial [bacterium]|nr:hypothetical protein [bacterium]
MSQLSPDPLQILFSEDVKSLDRQRIAEFLKPFVLFDRSSKQIGFLPEFEKIDNNTEKIEIILLASKARSMLSEGTTDGMSQGEIIDLGVVPEGSVKSTLNKLSVRAKKIKKNGDGIYYL